MVVEVIADGLAFPEGPVVLPDGLIACVQMAADVVTVLGPAEETATQAPLARRDLRCPGGPNGMVLTAGGRHAIVCLNGGLTFTADGDHLLPGIAEDPQARGGLTLIDLDTGTLEPVIGCGPDSPVSGPNDVVLSAPDSPAGEGIWFTDLGRRLDDGPEPGGVFWFGGGLGVVRAAYPRPGRPNGIALSADGATLYVTESASAQIWAWPILGPGELREPLLVRQFAAPARLDGIAVTAAGNLVVATLVLGELTTLSPTGQVLSRVAVDDPMPTNVCFGGSDHTDLFVTLGATGRLVRLPWPEPGLSPSPR